MKYIVTGGAGFIGSNFILQQMSAHSDVQILNVDSLTYAGNLDNLSSVANDPRYSFAKVDICSTLDITELICSFDPDCIVNFAAESHVDRSIADPSAFIRSNVEGTASLLNAAMNVWMEKDFTWTPGKKFLQVSTDEVYGSLSLDLPDELFHEDTPVNPHSPYSASKAAADLLVLAFCNTYNFPALVTRCSNNYGPRQFPEKLIPLMIRNCLAHNPLPVYGDGLNVRDWLYVEDHCRAIEAALRNGKVGQVYNIGGHNEHSNLEIVRTVIAECSKQVNDSSIDDELIAFVEDRKGHDRRYGIAPDKAMRELGWQPEIDFETGIKATVRWYLDNRLWLDRIESGEYRDM